MNFTRRSNITQQFRFAVTALRMWTGRQFAIAAAVGVVFALLIGIATVLIPNPWFARDIEPVWWNYPVWIATSALAGLLTATYVRPSKSSRAAPDIDDHTPEARISARMGIAGSALAWFAVGCPVCNKIALIALGYTGALTWFAPVQPLLAIAAMILTGVALVWRLKGQVSCSVPQLATSSVR